MKTHLTALTLLITLTGTGFTESTNPEEQLGLSNDQLLSMGVLKWRDFYMQKFGADAFHEKNAYGVYARCLQEKIHKQLSERPTSEQTFFKKLDSHLSKLLNYRIDIEYSTGGGTVLSLLHTSYACEETQLLLDLLCGAAKTTRMKEADVWNAVKEVRRQIGETLSHAQNDSGYFVTLEQAHLAKQKFDSMNAELESLCSLLEPRSPSERNHVMDYLSEIITLKLGQ